MILEILITGATAMATTPQYRTHDVIDRLEMIESGGDEKAEGDDGRAVGVLQIHEIMVREVNRILGRAAFDYSDRWDRKKSRQMAFVFLSHQIKLYHEKHGAKPTSKLLACSWNSGSILSPPPPVYLAKVSRLKAGGPK